MNHGQRITTMRYLALCLGMVLIGTTAAKDPTKGSDWPRFLGPLGTSVSTEKGIIKPWPKDGLRVVWHLKTGESYCVPSISNGRAYFFDRHGDQVRLSCLDART